jgi:hypothetical protein
MSARTLLVSSLVLATTLFCFAPRVAQAENPNVTFSGRVMVSDKRFPQTAKSPSAYVAAIRKQAKTNFKEDKENQQWKIYFAGFLRTKLNDVEYIIKIYDVTSKSHQLLQSFEQFTTDRGQQTIISSMVLERKTMGVNKELMMTMESKGKVLASGRFKILGQGEKLTGKVDFSDEDTKKKD